MIPIFITIAQFLGFKYYIDTTYLYSPRPNVELHSYMKEGMIENWDFFEKVIDYSYDKVILSR